MDCTICGKATLPGAMLCVPCKAALKRARYITVQESLRRPSIIDVRRKPRRARPADPTPEPARRARPADSIPPPQSPPRARVSPDVIKTFHAGSRVFVALLFVAVLAGAVYFGQRELSANASSGGSVAAPAVGAATVESVATPQAPAVETAPVMVPPPAATIAVAPEVKPAAATAKRKMLANRTTFATADGDPPDAVAPPPEPEKPVPVAVPPPRPAPDRWQNMRDAQAECDRLGMFDGLICGQRVRLQYCEGYWGKVAQCQGANAGYER